VRCLAEDQTNWRAAHVSRESAQGRRAQKKRRATADFPLFMARTLRNTHAPEPRRSRRAACMMPGYLHPGRQKAVGHVAQRSRHITGGGYRHHRKRE
jgi:hypothetical protein